MIAFLRGEVASVGVSGAVIDVNGIGFSLGMSTRSVSSLPPMGEQVQVWTYLQTSDAGIALYGFSTDEERLLFNKLIAVSGVGPKVALSALSSFSPGDLSMAIADGDDKRIATIPGIGRKTAQRIILELKGALSDVPNLFTSATGQALTSHDEVSIALLGMGFTTVEIELALRDYDGAVSDEAAAIRYALKRLGVSR